jgi:putative PIG3 family NAD(P)H quinone oxidoreductase
VRAVTIKDGELAVAEHPDPVPGSGEVLVKVRAAGINGADIHQRAGRYPAPPDSPQDIPGLELAGEVVENGPGAFRFSPGDRVMSIVGGGGQSELAAVPERLLLTVPNNLDITHAGGAPEVFTTAHDALFTQANLQLGEKLLIHGGAGGVGTAAVQLGRAAGARVYATVRNPELRGGVEQLGATVLAPDEFTDHGPFDVILELVGGPNLSDNVNSLNMLGRISVIGIGAGANGELNLGALLSKRGRIMASMIRYRPLEDKAATARGMERSVLPLFETGELTVPVAATFPLEQAADAYDRFTAGGKLGKIILTID